MWYSTLWADAPLPWRWVLLRDPKAKLATKGYCSTEVDQAAASIGSDFVKRWNIEVTFVESRAHLGIETQGQWSDLATCRTTPVWLGLYSLTCLFTNALHCDGQISLYRSAWYSKPEATFSDVLAAVRKALSGYFSFETSPTKPDVCLVPLECYDSTRPLAWAF
jgi:hypothetical protein